MTKTLSSIVVLAVSVWLAVLPPAPAAAEEAESSAQVERAKELLAKARNAIAAVHDYQGTLIKHERFGEELSAQRIEFKFSRPFKVYVKYVEPILGQEGIYVRGWNKNKMRAHKGTFPDITVSLDPLGRRAMDNNHHPITSFGLETMLEVIRRNIGKGLTRGDMTVEVSDGGVLFGKPVWRIAAQFKKGGRTVTVKPNEDLWKLADRVGQDMYVILHHNDDIDSPTDIDAGDKVFVPYHYASRAEYFISKLGYMLIKVSSWDQNGKLYESYEYVELELDPGLTQWDFDPRNTEYNFADQR